MPRKPAPTFPCLRPVVEALKSPICQSQSLGRVRFRRFLREAQQAPQGTLESPSKKTRPIFAGTLAAGWTTYDLLPVRNRIDFAFNLCFYAMHIPPSSWSISAPSHRHFNLIYVSSWEPQLFRQGRLG